MNAQKLIGFFREKRFASTILSGIKIEKITILIILNKNVIYIFLVALFNYNYIIYPIIVLCVYLLLCRMLIIPQNNTFVDFIISISCYSRNVYIWFKNNSSLLVVKW